VLFASSFLIETRSLPALARRYLAALPSMSLIPVAPFLLRFGSCGRNNSRPRQEPTGQINQALVTLFSVASTTEISSGFFAVVNSRSEQRPVALPVLRQGERSESVAFTPHIEHTKLVQVLCARGCCCKTNPIKSAA